jgi:hypothetical protein
MCESNIPGFSFSACISISLAVWRSRFAYGRYAFLYQPPILFTFGADRPNQLILQLSFLAGAGNSPWRSVMRRGLA